MDKNLQQRLESVLDGNNKEAVWTMGLRYLSEETLCWAMGANYPSANLPDHEYDVERFIEAWESNTDYEIVMAGEFEGKADIAVGRDYSNDCVKVTLYGASTEDGDPGLYAALLRHVADWIDKNAGAVRNREEADIDVGYPGGFTTDENPFKNEIPEWMGLGSDGAMHGAEYVQWANRALARGGEDQEDTGTEMERPDHFVTPCRAPVFVHGETYVFPDDSVTAYGPYLAQRSGDEWLLLWIKPDMPIDGKVAMYTKAGTLYHASGQPVNWYEFLTMSEWEAN